MDSHKIRNITRFAFPLTLSRKEGGLNDAEFPSPTGSPSGMLCEGGRCDGELLKAQKLLHPREDSLSIPAFVR